MRPTNEAIQLGHTPWPAIGKALLLIPVGSTEQHGPHLPLGTDSMIAEALANATAQALQTSAMQRSTTVQTLVAPTLNFTASGEHEGFPGTVSIGTEVFTSVLIELVRSASTWCDRIVFVNGHGGNAEAFQVASQTWKRESRNVIVWSPSLPAAGDWHAGWVETSVMLALRPELVGSEREPGEVGKSSEVVDKLRSVGVLGVSVNGVLGDPALATAEKGHKLLDEWTTALVSIITEWI